MTVIGCGGYQLYYCPRHVVQELHQAISYTLRQRYNNKGSGVIIRSLIHASGFPKLEKSFQIVLCIIIYN